MTATRTLASILGLSLLAAAPVARAAPYEIPIQVDNEEDLYELYHSDQISEDTFQTLLELLRRGVDLSSATREEIYSLPGLTYQQVDLILAYRKEAGKIDDPVELVAAGVLDDAELLSIAPFLVLPPPGGAATYATDGWLRVPAVWSADEASYPAMALQGRLRTFKHMTAGVALVLTRNRLGEVVFDPNRDALAAEAPSSQLHAPKVFALWDTGRSAVLLGTYRAGFGQRLTFDDTDRYTPNGFYPDDTIYRDADLTRMCKEAAGELGESPCTPEEQNTLVAPDQRWREGLFGVAAAARRIETETGWVQAVGFLSAQSRSIYQYEIYDRARCDDPRADTDACKAPDVYRWQEDVLEPASRFSYHTLPDMFRELLGGLNVTGFSGRRAHLGVTAYGATIDWLVDGMDLDFQEWSRYPRGGPFGAVGADAVWGVGLADFGVEVARSFDSAGEGGGGFGGILRNTATWGDNELELSLRWYEKDYLNPYAGPIAAADEFEGQRARDEAGVRLRWTGVHERRLNLRAFLDFWVTPSTDVPKLLAYLRADYRITDAMDAGLWGQVYDKDLTETEPPCFETAFDDIDGEPVPCAGRQARVAGRFRVSPLERLTLSAQYQHTWEDDPAVADMRQELSAWLVVVARPFDPLRLRARVRILDERLHSDSREESTWAYLDATFRLPRDFLFRVRYDLYDLRSSDPPRVDHWLLAEVQAWF